MARQADGRFIVGRDVPSRELARVLSGLALFQPILQGDFRVRLAGMALRRRFGRDVTGEKLSEIMSVAQFDEHGRRMRDLLESGQPFVVETRLNENGRLKLCYEWLAPRVLQPMASRHGG
ncbi:MAG TPA: PAS domain-containing protein [Rhizomicrobium sp.]